MSRPHLKRRVGNPSRGITTPINLAPALPLLLWWPRKAWCLPAATHGGFTSPRSLRPLLPERARQLHPQMLSTTVISSLLRQSSAQKQFSSLPGGTGQAGEPSTSHDERGSRGSLGTVSPRARLAGVSGERLRFCWLLFNPPTEPTSVFIRPPTEFPMPKINLGKGLLVLANLAGFGAATSLFPWEFSTGLCHCMSLLMGGWQQDPLWRVGRGLQTLRCSHSMQEEASGAGAPRAAPNRAGTATSPRRGYEVGREILREDKKRQSGQSDSSNSPPAQRRRGKHLRWRGAATLRQHSGENVCRSFLHKRPAKLKHRLTGKPEI